MAERTNADHGLVDACTANLGGPRTAALLSRLGQAVAWDTLVKPILALPEYRGAAKGENKGGRPAWPALTMLKCVLLAKWFGLSDPQPEECLQDRLSFRRFVGLSLTDATPNETTFVRFRTRLREAHLERRGVCCAIAFKRQPGQKDLPPLLRRLNRVNASVRAVVEHPFACMKSMGCRRGLLTTCGRGLHRFRSRRSRPPRGSRARPRLIRRRRPRAHTQQP